MTNSTPTAAFMYQQVSSFANSSVWVHVSYGKKSSDTLSSDARLLAGRAVNDITFPVYTLRRLLVVSSVIFVFHLLKRKIWCVVTLFVVSVPPPHPVFTCKGDGDAWKRIRVHWKVVGRNVVWRTISGDKELLLCRICASIDFLFDVSDQRSLCVLHAEH